MKIAWSPMRRQETLRLHRAGDVLTINGEAFDLGPLPDGASLPAEAIASDWFDGPVERIEGELHLALVLPHGPRAPEATRFPTPLTVEGDGPVAVPVWSGLEPDPEERYDVED